MNGNSKQGSPEEEYSAELIEFAREYHSSEFFDVDRSHCPPPEELAKIVSSASFPDELIRNHLLACSPCFLEFNRLRTEYPIGGAIGAGRTILPRVDRRTGLLVLTAAAAVVLIGMSMLLIPGNRAKYDAMPDVAVEASSQAAPAPSGVDERRPEVETASEPNRNTRIDEKPIRTIGFDLARLSVSRNSSDSLALTRVPAEKVRVRVELRPGSLPGAYSLALLDEFGKTLLSPVFVRSSGRTVTAVMDLTKHLGPSRLCVLHADEIPDCVPLEVASPR